MIFQIGGAGGDPIDEDTAENWVDESEGACWFESGWEFEWGPQSAFDPGDTLVGSAGDPWKTFGPTDTDGMAMTELNENDLEDNSAHIWMREILKNGYIPFTHGPSGNNNSNDVSAEIYCHIDVLNYDNYDRVDGIELDETYYCVAWNVLETDEPEDPEYGPYCGDGEVNQEWEQCDGGYVGYGEGEVEGGICNAQCQFDGNNQCTDLVLAKVTIEDVENKEGGSGDMTDNIYLGSNTPIPNNVWFLLHWFGSYAVDPDISGYEDVPGLAVERREGALRSVMHGSTSGDDEEHVHGDISFWSWDSSVEATSVDSDGANGLGKSNKLEGDWTDGSGLEKTNAGDDEVWISDGDAFFWLTTTTADDGFLTQYSEAPICEECEDELGGGWADNVEDYNRAKKKDGTDITDPNRTDPEEVLDEEDWEPGDNDGFFSLGFGGWIIVSFKNFVPDVEGNDISIHEATNGTFPTGYPEETALIEVSQDGSVWYELGQASNLTGADRVTYFDFASTGLAWIKYVRVTDTTDSSPHDSGADGFDLDAVDATQTFCKEPDEESGGEIYGAKWNDEDGDGIWGEELGLSGWVIELYLDGSLVHSTTTDDDGEYWFTDLIPGTYDVCEIQQGGWIQTYPSDDACHEIEVGEGTVSKGNNFGNKKDNDQCLVEGYKYDENGSGLLGWIIGLAGDTYFPTLTELSNGVSTLGTDETDETGYYCIDTKRPEIGSNYKVFEELKDGWNVIEAVVNGATTTPSADSFFDVFVDVSLGEDLRVDFYNKQNTTQEEPSCSLSASETVVDPGAEITLFWTSSNATSGSIDQGIGTVTPVGGGSTNVTVVGNTTYTGTFGDGLATTTCDVSVSVNQPSNNGGGDNGGGGDGDRGPSASGRRDSNPEPQVLGAATQACGMYLFDYLRINLDNDPFEVMKLQAFLTGQGFFTPLTSIFDATTDSNVRLFQAAHKADVLTPWLQSGIVPHDDPTGYVYQTTRWKINNIVCPDSEPFPDPLI